MQKETTVNQNRLTYSAWTETTLSNVNPLQHPPGTAGGEPRIRGKNSFFFPPQPTTDPSQHDTTRSNKNKPKKHPKPPSIDPRERVRLKIPISIELRSTNETSDNAKMPDTLTRIKQLRSKNSGISTFITLMEIGEGRGGDLEMGWEEETLLWVLLGETRVKEERRRHLGGCRLK